MHCLGLFGEPRENTNFGLAQPFPDLFRLLDHAIHGCFMLTSVSAIHTDPAAPERAGASAINDRASAVTRRTHEPLPPPAEVRFRPDRQYTLPLEVNNRGERVSRLGKFANVYLLGPVTNHMETY